MTNTQSAHTTPEPRAEQPDIETLLNRIADSMRLAASIPADRRLASRDWIASYLDVSLSTTDRIVAKPGFPAPIKIEGGPLRWRAKEVMDWAEQQSGARVKR